MEQPLGDSDEGLIERLGNALTPEAPVEEAVEVSPEENEQPVAEQAEEEEVEAAPEDDGLVELELEDGETLRVPQKLKDGYLRQSDYTRKTQDLAAAQKQAHSQLETQALYQKFQESTREQQDQLATIQAELKQYRQIDWTKLDTDQYVRFRGHVDQLKETAAELEKTLEQEAGKAQEGLKKIRDEQTKTAYEFLGRHVKGWQPDSAVEREAAMFANQHGVSPEVLAEVLRFYPAFGVFIHRAAQYDKLQATKGQAVQKAQKAPPVVKPGATQSTGTGQAQKTKALRDKVRKDGDLRDVAQYFLHKGF